MSEEKKPIYNPGEILVDTYGKSAPAAAKFGVGTSTREGAQQAQDARREVKPGQYEKR